MWRGRGLLLAGLVASILLVGPAYADEPSPNDEAEAAAADPSLEARAHHRRGVELYDEGDLRLALVEFERAYAIGRSYKVLFNIGQVQLQLVSYAKARLAFEQYLALGGDRIDARRRADVERDLAVLRNRTATLTVRTNVPDAEVMVDDLPLAGAFGGVLVDAGTLRIKASRAGYATGSRELTLVGGEVRTVDIVLARSQPDVVVTQTMTGLPGHTVAAWIIGGVLVAGTVGTAIAAKTAASDYDRQRETPISGSPAEARASLERQRDLVQGLAITTDVLGLASLVAGGVALYLTLREPKRDAPRVHAGLGRASFELSF